VSAAEDRFQQQLREALAAAEADAEAAHVQPRRRVRREPEMPNTMLDGWSGLSIIMGSLLVLLLLQGWILTVIL
jgi:hypothetical protein